MAGTRAGAIVVTGAGGFIGSAVARRASRAGIDVRAHVGPVGTALQRDVPAEVATFGDVCDSVAMASLVAGASAVIHLAGPPSVAQSFDDPAGCARAHVGGTATVASACVHGGVPRLVYVSSAEVYGSPEAPSVAEGARLDPRSPYAAAKVGAEAMLRAVVRGTATGVVVTRPFSVYGPGGRPDSVVGRVIEQAVGSDEIALLDLTPVRDYVFVDDVVDALLVAALDDGAALGTGSEWVVCNLGSGVGTSVAELAATAVAVAGRDLPIVEAGGADRPGSAAVARLVADVGEAKRVLGWVAKTTLADGLAATMAARQA